VLEFDSGHESQVWAVLAGTGDTQQFSLRWLTIQCRLIQTMGGSLALQLIDSERSGGGSSHRHLARIAMATNMLGSGLCLPWRRRSQSA
jgi:hypothetical protein